MKAELTALGEVSHDPLFVLEREGPVRLLSSAAQQLLGLRREEVEDRLPAVELFADPADLAALWRQLDGREGPASLALRLRSRRGEALEGRLRALRLPDEPEQPALLLASFRDPSKTRTLERRLARATEQVLDGEERLRNLRRASHLAHQLAQPLTAAMGLTELLAFEGEPEERARRLERLAHQLQRMAQLLRQLERLEQGPAQPGPRG